MKLLGKSKVLLMGSKRSSLELARGRVIMLSIFFVLAYIIVTARVIDLSLIQGSFEDYGVEIAHLQPEADIVKRGDIYDRNGVLLARSLQTASLYADPVMIQNPVEVTEDLANLFPDLAYGDLLQKLQSKRRFVWIKRNLSPEDHQKVLYLGHPGLNFKKEDRRIYPQGSLVSHVVGYTSIDGQGLAGVEASFDALLGEGRAPLHLTVDVRLQHALRREIQSAMETFSAKAGAGLIMDVQTGEVLSAVSLPDYDPHDFSEADKEEKFNRVSLGVYELGSTFKIFSTAALLETKKPDMSMSFDAREPLRYGRFTISDYHPEERLLSLPEVFIYSSNIGSALMGEMIGTEALKNFYADLGLMTAPQIELHEIGAPLVPSPWRDINTLTASYGHGIAVSPLHLVNAVSTIVNGGLSVKPTLILQQNNPEKATNQSEVRVVSPQTAHRMRQLMRLVVTDGTGKIADVPRYQVGGKTGTAEKAGAGGYDRRKLLSSFLGVFPMSAPKYAVFVMIDEPKGTAESYGYATGGWVAAPAVAKVINAMVSILGIPPVEEDELASSLKRYVKSEEQIERERLQYGAQIESH